MHPHWHMHAYIYTLSGKNEVPRAQWQLQVNYLNATAFENK